MFIILGGTGHVGSSVAEHLLEKGENVTIVSHNPDKKDEWEKRGAKFTVADVNDTEKLREVFKTGKRAFLLNPPGDISGDSVADEKQTVASIVNALKNSGIKKVVAESTYGARSGEGIGDLAVLYEFEQKIKETKIPASIIRAAYYMSNWEISVESAKNEGKIYSFYPPDFKLPMVAPHDIGKIAAKLLTESIEKTGINYVEGPEIYSIKDVAEAFEKALDKKVEAVEIPKDEWISSMKETGFSDIAARSMAKMTEVTLEDVETAENPLRGETTLDEYIKKLTETK